MLVSRKQNRRSGSDRAQLVPPVNKPSRISLIVSIVFVLGSCLFGLLFWVSYDQTTPVVVATENISPGEIIQRDDVKLVDSRSEFDHAGSFDQVVGRVASRPITAGDPLSDVDVNEQVSVEAGKTVLGVLLKPGGYPTPNIAAGSSIDRVFVKFGVCRF